MSIESLLNKENLKIARENAGFSTREATSKISSAKEDRVASWEVGEAVPTFRQLERLAQEYQTSPLVLLSDKLISRHRSVPDYRRQEEDEPLGQDKVNKLINLVMKRQGWLEKKLSQVGYSKNPLIGSGRSFHTPQSLAKFIVETLSIKHDDIVRFSGDSGKDKTLKYLIDLLESKNIFIGKTLSYHKIAVSEMRGLFLNSDIAPFIVLNRKDAVAAQIFTLMHEVAHLFRATEGISKPDFRTISLKETPGFDREEVFCNKAAAEILIPTELVTGSHYTEKEVKDLAEHFNVSNLFAFYRLKALNKLLKDGVDQLEQKLIAETREAVRLKEIESSKRDGGNYVNSMRDSNGTLFNRIVQEFYSKNDIGYSEASNVLKFSVEQV